MRWCFCMTLSAALCRPYRATDVRTKVYIAHCSRRLLLVDQLMRDPSPSPSVDKLTLLEHHACCLSSRYCWSTLFLCLMPNKQLAMLSTLSCCTFPALALSTSTTVSWSIKRLSKNQRPMAAKLWTNATSSPPLSSLLRSITLSANSNHHTADGQQQQKQHQHQMRV